MIDLLDIALAFALTDQCAKFGGSCDRTPEGLLSVNATFDPKEVLREILDNMREPTEAMLRAVDDQDSDKYVARGRAVSAWQSMIDKALDNAP